MNLHDNISLLLQIGDLKLTDTEYTFGKHKVIENFEYTPLNEDESEINYPSQLGIFIKGDHRLGTKISTNDNKIYLAYGANRPSSNAQSIAIGYFNNHNYYFIKECFSNIYDEKPELTARTIIITDNLFHPTEIDETIIFQKYNHTESPLTEINEQFFRSWLKNITIFKSAFSQKQLTALSRERFMALGNNEEKQKYLKYYQ